MMDPKTNPSSCPSSNSQKLSSALSETRDFGRRKQQQQSRVPVRDFGRRKKQQSRDPFRDLSNNKCGDCGTQVETSRGCLRLSSLSCPSTPPSSTAKPPSHAPTPTHYTFKPQRSSKSAPNTKLNSISKRNKPETNHPTSSLRHHQSRKRQPTSPFVPLYSHSSLPDSSSSLPNYDLNNTIRSNDANTRVLVHGTCHPHQPSLTPVLASKVATGSSLNFSFTNCAANDKYDAGTNPGSGITDTKTPPIQASVSPEIQCNSSVMSTTTKTPVPPCYGAGHVLSGVIDRRKCRPRGILTVGEPRPFSSFDTDDDAEQDNIEATVSALPFAVEASVCWLLSPCHEEDENQKNCETEFCLSRKMEDCTLLNFPPGSPLSRENDPIDFCNDSINISISTDFCNDGINTGISTANTRRSVSPLSPAELVRFRGFLGSPLTDDVVVSSLGQENSEHSPSSTASPVTVNVIQTPRTHSSSDTRATMYRLGADAYNAKATMVDFEKGAEHSQTTNSDAIHLAQVQEVFYDQDSSTLEKNASESQMRLWRREGLVNKTFEMDEFDRCRCLSDEEDVVYGLNDNQLNPHWSSEHNTDVKIPDSSFGSIKTIVTEYGIDEKGKVDCLDSPKVLCSCAESISTDGGGLACSDDSDWILGYKKQFS